MSLTAEKVKEIQGDLLCCAFEGGSNYWYCIEDQTYPEGKSDADFRYPHLELPFAGGALEISAEDHQNPDDRNGLWKLDGAAVERGWKLMHDKAPRHYGNAISEDFDAETGDVFLQLCLFGEVIFG